MYKSLIYVIINFLIKKFIHIQKFIDNQNLNILSTYILQKLDIKT